MSIEVKLPELGENIESGDLLKVLVKPGDRIRKDQAVLELETDKAAIEVPSPIEGVVKQVNVKQGQKIKVGQTILLVDEDGAGAGQERAPAAERVGGGIAQGAMPPAQQPAGKAQETRQAELGKEVRPPAQPARPTAPPQQREPRAPAPPADTAAKKTTEVKLPELGENIQSGDLLKVLIKRGDRVTAGQSLVEIETDKAAIEVPSPVAGTVRQVLVTAGQKVKVGQSIVVLEEEAVAAPEMAPHPEFPGEGIAEGALPPIEQPLGKAIEARTGETAAPERPPEVTRAPAPAAPRVEEVPQEITSRTGIRPSDVAASPSVRALAREIGVDITEVQGSGPGGRINRSDVKEHARKKMVMMSMAPVGVSLVPLPDFTRWGKVDRKPMSSVRRKTAEHMQQAWIIPHVTNDDVADITNLERLRKQFSDRAEQAGGKLTMTAIALKIVASALKVFPQFAASIDLAKQEIAYKQYVHIGVAVDTERGLLVPVLRDVDRKNIMDLSVELNQLAQRARDRKLKPEEMEGSVFTITNLGGIGGTSFTPIINSPEVAILGIMRASWEAVYINEKFEPRLMLPLSLSYDHRLIDGADASRFLRWLCEAFEQPFLLSLEG